MSDINQDKEIQEQNSLFPSSIKSEQYLLGSILLNNELFFSIDGFMQDKYFFHLVHIKIYNAMSKLFNKSLHISVPTIGNILHDDPDFIKNNGENYLLHLSSLAISIHNPLNYANIIYDLALKRSLITIGTELIQSTKTSDLTITALEQISDVENKLFLLATQGNQKKEFESISKSIDSSIKMIDLARKEQKNITGISSGLIDIDKKLSGLHNSDLIIIAGRPSMGKTAFALNIALNIASDKINNKKPSIGFFSLEMSSEQLAMRMLAIKSNINTMLLKEGKIKEEKYNLVRETAQELSDFNFFLDDTPALLINNLASRAKRLKRQQEVDIIFIDYLQLIRTNNRIENRVLEISEITQSLKALAKELNIPVVVMSQLSRAVEQRQDKKPVLSDLRDSGTIEQDADIVMFLYREEYYLSRTVPELGSKEYENWQNKMDTVSNIAEIIIAKHRNGPIGNVQLAYDSNISKFSNTANRFISS